MLEWKYGSMYRQHIIYSSSWQMERSPRWHAELPYKRLCRGPQQGDETARQKASCKDSLLQCWLSSGILFSDRLAK